MGNSVTIEYDAAGNEVAVYDAPGVRSIKTTYDSRGFAALALDAFGHSYSSILCVLVTLW